MSKQYIGNRKVKSVKETQNKTAGGINILEVHFEDRIEKFSKLMFDNIVSEKPCNLTELRDKRVDPVVQIVLAVLREWGIKVGELDNIMLKVNQSLNYNNNQALLKLLGQWMPDPKSLDDVDLLTLDDILRDKF